MTTVHSTPSYPIKVAPQGTSWRQIVRMSHAALLARCNEATLQSHGPFNVRRGRPVFVCVSRRTVRLGAAVFLAEINRASRDAFAAKWYVRMPVWAHYELADVKISPGSPVGTSVQGRAPLGARCRIRGVLNVLCCSSFFRLCRFRV